METNDDISVLMRLTDPRVRITPDDHTPHLEHCQMVHQFQSYVFQSNQLSAYSEPVSFLSLSGSSGHNLFWVDTHIAGVEANQSEATKGRLPMD